MRDILIGFTVALCITYMVIGLLEVDRKTVEWNAFLEVNNCVLLKTAPSLRTAKCYICDDGITYCK